MIIILVQTTLIFITAAATITADTTTSFYHIFAISQYVALTPSSAINHCMALNSFLCADVLLRTYTLALADTTTFLQLFHIKLGMQAFKEQSLQIAVVATRPSCHPTNSIKTLQTAYSTAAVKLLKFPHQTTQLSTSHVYVSCATKSSCLLTVSTTQSVTQTLMC